MAVETGTYQEYARRAIENYASIDAESRNLLVDAVKNIKVERVLDVGCGAGQEFLPFLEKTDAYCVGIDVAKELRSATKELFQHCANQKRVSFLRSSGEKLPFADESFDVVLCRVALPYMNNRQAIGEISRVLRPGGIFLLKTHAPAFYFGMLRRRMKLLSAKQFAYPLICLAGSIWHQITGRQLSEGFWKGKEVFQTRRFLEKEFAKNNLRIKGFLADTNIQTPSFLVEKFESLKLRKV